MEVVQLLVGMVAAVLGAIAGYRENYSEANTYFLIVLLMRS